MLKTHSQNLRDVLHKLLKTNKTKRLGKTKGGAGAVMKTKWYRYRHTHRHMPDCALVKQERLTLRSSVLKPPSSMQ